MKCKNCLENNVIKYSKWSNGEFCSKECARAYSTKNKREEINQKVSKTLADKFKTGELKYNKICEKGSFVANKISIGLKKYHKKTKEKLKQELPFEKWKTSWIKEFLFEEIGNMCEKCGHEYTDSTTGKGPFQIHHIDGNKKNWKRNNLQILCMNCHWKTSNWGFKNRTHKKESIEKGLKTSIKNGIIKDIQKKDYKHILTGVV